MSDHRWGSLLVGVLWLVLTGTAGWVVAQPVAPQTGSTTGGSPNAAPSPPTIPVAVPAPNPTYQTKQAELQVISTEVLDRLLKQPDDLVEWAVWIFSLILVVPTLLVGGIYYIFERQQDREFQQEKERAKEELNQRFGKLAEETKVKLATEVEGQVKALFENRYEERIVQFTKALTQEALMTTPDARNNLVSILRRTVNELSSVVTRLPDDGEATELHRLLAGAIEDWHILGQLYSPNREQLEAGLLAVRARPIPEALDRLRRLQRRYPTDADLLPNIVEAIEAVEQVEQQV